MEYIQIYADVLLHHKAKQKWNRIIKVVNSAKVDLQTAQ